VAAARAGDVALLINNAGVGHAGGFLASDSEEVARRQLETNYFGVLRMSKAFAPILAANGGGAILNVLSIVSWVNGGQLAAYAASKIVRLIGRRSPRRSNDISRRISPSDWRSWESRGAVP
jgi:short-subunit dehydrogenase